MDVKSVLEIIGVIISAGTLSVSVLVFINTVRKTQVDRKQNLATEKFYSFLKSIESFLKLVDPQKIYDSYSIIFGKNKFDYAEKYAELKRFDAEMFYQLEEIKLYSTDEVEDCLIVIDELNAIFEQVKKINELFCNELNNLFNNLKSIDRKEVATLQDSYLANYNEKLTVIFGKLHIIRNSIVYKRKKK